MKIDLHCHTKEIKAGDKGRAIDADAFFKKLQSAGVSIAAITNHNTFDIDQYKEFVQAADSSIMVWPGVELDVSGHYGDEKSLINDYSDDFKPSNGEHSILLVNAALNNRDCDVILLDEPDSGMGADYINDILIPEIRARASENKIIVIVTHDPNMVVRTHPYSCLYRIEGEALSYKSYIGSSFEEFMHNPDDTSDKKSWVDSVLSICEVGTEAFNERMITYGEYGYYKY